MDRDRELERLHVECVNHEADRHFALYQKTGNGMLLWKAYAVFRRERVPVPEYMLKVFDDMGEALLESRDQSAVMRALHLVNRKGGPQRNTRLKGAERQRDMVEEYRNLLLLDEKRRASNERRTNSGKRLSTSEPGELAEIVAKRFDTTRETVQTRYSEWGFKSPKTRRR
ncbi:MAG: hypothetical protein JJU27_14015 [Gammaproteobacteria bacterium]|nr:hypothetical protein [Gammaproteobacteria bacterium]